MRKRLVCASHNAEPDVLVSMLHERRNNRVKRTLPWAEDIWRTGIERKQCATILQYESQAAHGNAGPERLEITLDERNDVAFAIDRGQICSVTARRTVRNVATRVVRV